MKNKILILGNHEIVIYNFRKELIESLINNDYEVYLSFPKGDRVDFFEKLGCHFIDTEIERHGTNPIKDLKLMLFYRKIMKKIKPDIVLTYTIKPNIYGGLIAAMLNIPYIANITGLGTAVEKKGLIQKITTYLYRVSFRKIQTVFLQNEENQQFFIDQNIAIDEQRLIAGSGVNLKQFMPLPYPDDAVVHFLYIARIMKEKGIDEYLDAAKYIKQKYPNTEFHVLGFCEESYEDRLMNLDKKGIIQYHGLQSNIKPFLEKSHCTVHPSYYPEGISNVLLESAASARPVITTNRSGCREVVDNMVNGYIVEQQNSKDLILKIEQFMKLSYLDKKNMGLKGRKKVEKEFDRNDVIKAYEEEIEKGITNRYEAIY